MEAEVKCRTFLNLLARKIQIFISAFLLFKPNVVGPRTGQSGEEKISISPANRTLIVQAVAFHFINWIDMIYLLTAIGLTPGGRSTAHIYTQTVHRTIKNKQHIEEHNNLCECGPCPVLARFTLAFALQLRKKHG